MEKRPFPDHVAKVLGKFRASEQPLPSLAHAWGLMMGELKKLFREATGHGGQRSAVESLTSLVMLGAMAQHTAEVFHLIEPFPLPIAPLPGSYQGDPLDIGAADQAGANEGRR